MHRQRVPETVMGAVDAAGVTGNDVEMTSGGPGLPREFTWRTEDFEVALVLEQWTGTVDRYYSFLFGIFFTENWSKIW